MPFPSFCVLAKLNGLKWGRTSSCTTQGIPHPHAMLLDSVSATEAEDQLKPGSGYQGLRTTQFPNHYMTLTDGLTLVYCLYLNLYFVLSLF